MSIPDFETRDVTEPLIEFVKTCPFLDKYHISMDPVSVQLLITDKPDGSAIDYVGSVMLSDYKDLIQKRYTERQANFQIWLLRKSNHNPYRQEIADFLFNFEQWVEHCQAYGLAPKLSQTREGRIEEVMEASGGAYVAEWDGKESSLYAVQISIRYFNAYNEYI